MPRTIRTHGPHDVDPRVPRTRRVVLEAVLAELAEDGYAGFTIESVASRAGVGKSTIYRHWEGKSGLIADALETLNVQPDVEVDLSPRQQVEGLLVHLAQAMRESPLAACVPALIEAGERDESIGTLFHRYSERRGRPLRAAIARGVGDGTFPEHVDAELAAQALAGAIVYRRVMSDAPLTPDEVPRLVATILGPA